MLAAYDGLDSTKLGRYHCTLCPAALSPTAQTLASLHLCMRVARPVSTSPVSCNVTFGRGWAAWTLPRSTGLMTGLPSTKRTGPFPRTDRQVKVTAFQSYSEQHCRSHPAPMDTDLHGNDSCEVWMSLLASADLQLALAIP